MGWLFLSLWANGIMQAYHWAWGCTSPRVSRTARACFFFFSWKVCFLQLQKYFLVWKQIIPGQEVVWLVAGQNLMRHFISFLSPAVFGSLNFGRDILSLAKAHWNVLYWAQRRHKWKHCRSDKRGRGMKGLAELPESRAMVTFQTPWGMWGTPGGEGDTAPSSEAAEPGQMDKLPLLGQCRWALVFSVQWQL